MANQVSNYQCPTCTGPLKFSGSTGRLECEYCGSSFTPEEIERFYAAKDAEAAAASTERPPEAGSGEWDTSGLNDDWGADGAKLRSYSCPSCGAELICEETTAASCCPYCGNPAMVPGQFSGALKPDYVIPFKHDRKAAIAALKNHYKGKPFLPGKFSSENQVEKVQGVYVPFWLFDGVVEGSFQFDGQIVKEYGSGDKKYTKTKHHDSRRAGVVRFEKVPTDASRKMDDDLMDSVSPYDYSELKPFSMSYFPGYLADRYDVDVEECAKRADRQCAATAEAVMADSAAKEKGYNHMVLKEKNVQIRRGKVYYALMPVWLLNTDWNGKKYVFAMNGQTGKLVGDLPVSAAKYWATLIGITAVLGTIINLFRG